MRIDETIHQAIADGTVTINEMIAAIARTWPEIDRVALETAAANAIAAGFAEADVRLVIEKRSRLLREGRADRLETARLMLEAGATNLQ